MSDFPSPIVMHKASMRLVDASVDTADVPFRDHVLRTMETFSGLNSIPRFICNVLTREYMIFVTRKGYENDFAELHDLAQEFKLAGFYIEVEDSQAARVSNTVSLCFCWDPEVIRNGYAKRTLKNDEVFQLYITVMQYIKAEQSLHDFDAYEKDTLVVGNTGTKDWVSISLVSQQMYEEALSVCSTLWNLNYYAGIADNSRRKGTWTLFVSWDKNVVENEQYHDDDFTFEGSFPATWK